MKKTLLTILISGIIFTSIGATAAYVYTARDINYQPSDENWNVENVQEAISELKTDVNNINNKVEGIERVYKAGEVELVALVSDDSFYKDSNDKYVLSNSDTGRTLLADTSTYKSLASTEECIGEVGADTAFPFKTLKVGSYQITSSQLSFSVDLGFVPKYVFFYHQSQQSGSNAGIMGIYQNDNNTLFSLNYSYQGTNAHPDDNALAINGSKLTITASSTSRIGSGYYVAIA